METVCRMMVNGIGAGFVRQNLNRHFMCRFNIPSATSFIYRNQNRHYATPPAPPGPGGNKIYTRDTSHGNVGTIGQLASVLEQEIQDETAELNHQLAVDGMPGFQIETDGAEIRLTKKHGAETINVSFNVSSSLQEWSSPAESLEKNPDSKQDDPEQLDDVQTDLVSMPDFQVQVVKGAKTLEFSCYFAEADPDDETGEAYHNSAEFDIHELVLYEGEPKSTEFAVSTEYFNEELQDSLMSYLSERGIDEEFGRNLVHFSTVYEKKQYIDMMQRLKAFVK